mmetsp:Transcript_9937/g.22128  ORF Transcript_9937/g.22128 Transcript_9937/m.22128 type:complete len:259 (+) Transcript_9937:247-1023(+)
MSIYARRWADAARLAKNSLATWRRAAAACSPVLSTSLLNIDSGLPSSSLGGAHSFRTPASITTTLSDSMTLSRRWAMVRMVRLSNMRLITLCTSFSVCGSMAAVASSQHSTGTLRSAARARHTSCICPSDQASEPVPLSLPCRPPALLTCSSSEASLITLISSASVCSSKGSRLDLTVPVNTTGSWGMMDRPRRRRLSVMLEMSTPSIMMEPWPSSNMRYRASRQVDLPEPVRPTMPTLSWGSSWKVTPLRANGAVGL